MKKRRWLAAEATMLDMVSKLETRGRIAKPSFLNDSIWSHCLQSKGVCIEVDLQSERCFSKLLGWLLAKFLFALGTVIFFSFGEDVVTILCTPLALRLGHGSH